MTVENPAPDPPKPSRPGKVTKWIFGIVVAAAATFITARLTGVFNDLWYWAFPEDPITVSVSHHAGCPWVFTAPVPDVQRALDSDHGSEIDMRRAGAIDGDDSTVEITVQAKPNKTVVLNNMRAVVDKSSPPTGGVVIAGCGALQPVRMFTADLDQPPSTAVPQAGQDSNGEPTPDFQHDKPTLKEGDPVEIFNFVVSTQACDCTWRIELDWTSDGRSDTTTVAVDDDGNPFRTIGTHTGDYQGAYIDAQSRQLVLLGPDGLPLK